MCGIPAKRKRGMQLKQDLATKSLEEYPDVFADIGNVNLYNGKEILCPEELEHLPSSMIYRDMKGGLRELRSDIRMQVKNAGMQIAVICIENQSDVCNTMPVRDLGYEYANYHEQIRTIKEENRKKGKNYFTHEIGDGQKLVPVIQMVLYYGEEEWKSPLSLFDMFDIPEEKRKLLEPYIQNHSIHLISLGKQDEETRKKYQSDFRLVVEYLACRDNEENLNRLMRDNVHKLKHPEEFLDVISAVAKDKRYREIKQDITNCVSKGEAVSMCIIAEKLENKGIQHGLKQGVDKVNQLNMRLAGEGRIEDILLAASDPAFQRNLMEEYKI